MSAGRWHRRALLRVALAGAMAPISRRANAEQKSTKAAARYQAMMKDGFSCGMCTLFRPPQSCVVVEGDISRQGWCRFFDLSD
jgi:hypothetical protein